MAKKAEIIVAEPRSEVASVETFIAKALETNVPVETMERLFDLRSKVVAQQAKQAFDEAMSNFQASCPTIKKTKSVHTRTGTKAYSYAPIESIVDQVKELLKENSLSYSFKMEMSEGKVKAICIVKHVMGHSEQSEMEVPFGSKTDIMSNSQVTAAASTFAKRYAFCNAFGIMTGDEDTDAKETDRKADKKPVSVKGKIMHLLGLLGVNVKMDGEALKAKIKSLTDLDPDNEEFHPGIVERLEALVAERNEHENA